MMWDPKNPRDMAIFQKIVGRHMSGDELLIRFSPGAAPETVVAGQ
jgi:hypothetical protein